MNHKPKNMLLKFFRFFTICFVIMLLASCYSKEDDKEPYRIKFYDDRIYVDSVELIEGTTISSEQIRNVEMKLNDYGMDPNVHYVWSIDRDQLVDAKFNEINYNETVYLFRVKDEYSVSINDSNMLTYKLINKDKIKYGDDVTFIASTLNGRNSTWFCNGESNNPNTSDIDFHVKNDVVKDRVRAAMGAEADNTDIYIQ